MENSSLRDFDTTWPPAMPNEKKQTTENGGEPNNAGCKCKTNLKSNGLVTQLMHLINNDERQKSTGAINRICCEKRINCCRPNVNGMIHTLRPSLLWLNDEKVEKLYSSPNLIDANIMEWSKGILNCECVPGDERMPNDNQTTTRCNEYKLNVSFSMNVTKIKRANQASEKYSTHVNILILGGGLAGLGAATAISNSKMKFTYKILEAQNEAGGRVKSVNLINYNFSKMGIKSSVTEENRQKPNMDAGAQWLHGRHNPLYTIADKYDLLTDDQSEEGLGAFLYDGGRQIDEFFVNKIDVEFGKMLKECEEFAQCGNVHKSNAKPKSKPKPKPKITKNKMYPKSVGHFAREHFRKFIHNQIDNQNDMECARDLFDWHERFQIIDNSCLSLDQLSAKYWGKYSFNGESCQAHYNFEQGFATCVDAILNELNANAIHFNKHVIEIQINSNTNCNRRSLKKSPNLIETVDESKWQQFENISVKCADGSCYTADHVLVTFPLGILKKTHQQLFKPGLPQQMRTAIDSLGYETINKIFLEFNSPWWNNLDGIQFIYDTKYDDDDEKKHWTRYLTGFDVLKPNNPNLLLGWVGGIGAVDMETLSDKQIIDDCIQLLSQFTNIDVPLPVRYFCTRWHSNPFINGSYSYISTNCDDNDTISKNWLNQKLTINDFYPMPCVSDDKSANDNDEDGGEEQDTEEENSNKLPIVLFAGEACHDKYFSTAHGAFLSGMEQAQKFMDEYI